MLHKPHRITWCYLNPSPTGVNWSSITDFSGIRTWHSALAVISMGKAEWATGKNQYEKCQSLVTCWHLSLMGMMQRRYTTQQRASTLASCRLLPMGKQDVDRAVTNRKAALHLPPCTLSSAREGTGVASARPTKGHRLCGGKGDVLSVGRSECGFPRSPTCAALAAACTHSLPRRFGSHCQIHSGWQDLMGLRFHPMNKVEHTGRWVRSRKVSGIKKSCLHWEID